MLYKQNLLNLREHTFLLINYKESEQTKQMKISELCPTDYHKFQYFF